MSDIVDKFKDGNTKNEAIESMSNSLKELNKYINKEIGVKGERSMELLTSGSISKLRNAMKKNPNAKTAAEKFGIKDTNISSLSTPQKIALLQSFLKNCCGDELSKQRSFYNKDERKPVDGDFGLNTALAVRGQLIAKGYFAEKGTNNKPKNKFDGKITDNILDWLLKDNTVVKAKPVAAATPAQKIEKPLIASMKKIEPKQIKLDSTALEVPKKISIPEQAAAPAPAVETEEEIDEKSINENLVKYGKNLNLTDIKRYIAPDPGDSVATVNLFDKLTIPTKNSIGTEATLFDGPTVKDNQIIYIAKIEGDENYYKVTIDKNGKVDSKKLKNKEIRGITQSEISRKLAIKIQNEKVELIKNINSGLTTISADISHIDKIKEIITKNINLNSIKNLSAENIIYKGQIISTMDKDRDGNLVLTTTKKDDESSRYEITISKNGNVSTKEIK